MIRTPPDVIGSMVGYIKESGAFCWCRTIAKDERSGAGEKGNDNFSQLKHGSQMFLNPVNREKPYYFLLA